MYAANTRRSLLRFTLLLGVWACSSPRAVAHAFQPTSVPPLVDVPVWSMATLNGDGTTNFNILTYATPVSIRPDRLYSLGLYKETLSYQNFCRDRKCVLQLLTAEHIPLVRLLGGRSGRDVDKERECATISDDVAFGLQELGSSDLPKVLPGCACYLRLSASGDIVDGGSHDIAICKVDEMLLPSQDYVANTSSVDYLSTGRLRELGIITEQGRIAD
mmetsp:Transcript_37356/g.81915  ORF Transcript_37356/g.81915 Transcript_37356/m.81915 type:complete len:217 (-) Transcript_37356:50-700(-)